MSSAFLFAAFPVPLGFAAGQAGDSLPDTSLSRGVRTLFRIAQLESNLLRRCALRDKQAHARCMQMRAGATCRTSANDWGAVVRKQVVSKHRARCTAVAPLHVRPCSCQHLHTIMERQPLSLLHNGF